MKHLHRATPALVLGIVALAAAATPAQVSEARVEIAGKGSAGCQNQDDPPTLGGGTPASATVDFRYDRRTGGLELTVTNTSKVVTGVANPLLTDLYLNLPEGAVTGVTLDSQKAAGGATPAFRIEVDPDLSVLPNPIRANCLGAFGIAFRASPGPVRGALANAAADTIVAPQGSWVVGPLQLRLTLSGPGIGTLDAATIASAFSRGAPLQAVTAAAKFRSGGPGGANSGVLGNAVGCGGAIWIVGAPRIGDTIRFCSSAAAGCHGCLLFSFFPGPTRFLDLEVQIGLPLLGVLGVPSFPDSNVVCAPLSIPDDPALVGKDLHMTTVTLAPSGAVQAGPRYTITFLAR